MNKKIVIGNWKMNPSSLKEAERLVVGLSKSISSIKKTEVLICAPFVFLNGLKKLSRKIQLGAQNVFWKDYGDYTGEISSDMLYNEKILYVIIGHSERRAMGESNSEVNKKIKASIKAGLYPILCVGENLRDENHEYLNFIKIQLEESLSGISKNFISKLTIAYEPLWAIGKGSHPATPEEFLEMSIFIKKILSDKFGASNMENMRILYGGSVDDKNAEGFIKEGKTDGFLVGRASLNLKKFSKIIEICEASGK